MRTLLRLVTAALAALLATTVLAAPASAHHDDWCPAYTSDGAPKEEYDIEAAEIPLEGVHYGLGVIKDFQDDIADKGIPVVSTIAGLTEKQIGAIMAGVTGVKGALSVARASLNAVNSFADGCRDDQHWLGTDHLLAAEVRRELAVTTTPLAQMLLPQEVEVDGETVDVGGLLDRKGLGVRDVVARTLADLSAAGQCLNCTSARGYLAQADAALADGRYKTAYRDYRRAYVAATS